MSWQKHMSRGTVAMVRADYRTAEKEFTHALKAARRDYGKDDERLLRTLGLLGQTYFKQGNYDQAQSLLVQSVDAGSQAAGNNLTVALDLISLAAIKKAMGETTEANQRYQQAVGVLQARARNEEISAAAAVSNLERMFAQAERSERERVQEQFQQLLVTARTKHESAQETEDFHPVKTDLLERWQSLMQEGKRHLSIDSEKADVVAYQQLHDATKLAYKIFPHDHINVADSLNLFGVASMRLKMHDQAEALLKRAATIFSAVPELAPELACVKLNLAAFYADVFEYRLSLQSLTEAAELLDHSAALTESNTSQVYGSTLMMMTRAELYASAREMIRQAIEAEDADRLEQASHLYQRTLTLLRRVFPDDHLEIAQILHFKANIMRKLGNMTEAAAAQNEADAIEARNENTSRKWEKLAAQLPPFRIPPSRILPD
ncbi:MAG TPA: tetratricopeptide repeat protein [Trichormus sp.]|jgi:tetratricopeptide (TPR) repeat protein